MKKNIYGLEIRLCVLFTILCCFCLPFLIQAQTLNQPPVAHCHPLEVTLNSSGYAIIDAWDINGSSYDPDGDDIELSIDQTYFDCGDLDHDVVVTLTVTDPYGASSSCTTYVTVIDETNPEAKCVEHFTVMLDEHGEGSLSYIDLNDGSRDNCGLQYTDITKKDFDCDDVGNQNVGVYVMDFSGNSNMCWTSVTVMSQPPSARCKDVTVELDPSGFGYIQPWEVNNGSYAVCGILTMEIDKSHFSCDDLGENDVWLQVIDKNNQSGYCLSTVTVVDNLPPEAECQPVFLNLDENGEAHLDINDLDDGSWDNCSPVWFTIDPPQTTFTCENLSGNSVTLLVHAGGLVTPCYTGVHVEDHITPQITCIPELFFPNYPGQCGAHIDPILPEPTVIENCSYQLTNNSTGSFPVGSHTIRWFVEDEWYNENYCDQIITVFDAEPPTIVCPPDIELTTDAGTCYAPLAESDLGIATADDNCGVTEFYNNFNDLFPDGKIPFGMNYVTYTAKDLEGNTAICNQLINVSKVQTITSVTVTPTEQQYSDPVTFRAEIDPGVCNIAGNAATHVTFYVGLQPMGPPVELNQTGQLLWAETTYDLLEYEGYEGTMHPDVNPKLVKASFSGLNDNFIVDNPNTGLTITPENACASYAGVLFASTAAANSSQAIVTLAATVIEEADGHTDDLLHYAKVQFQNGSCFIGDPVPLGWVTEGDKTIGTAIYEWPVDIGNANGITYSISAEIQGYYKNALGDCWAATDVTVSKPLGEFITGGGYLLLENSAGIKAGNTGSKNSFGFNVKFTKKLTSLQGNINTTFRRTEDGKTKVFNAKGTAFTSLAVVNNYAVFTGKAVIKNITDPLYPFDEEGNAIMQMSMTDNGDGTFDLLGITLWNKRGGLWFSSNWNGTKTVDQLLAAGNLVIHKSAVKSAEIIEINVDNNTPALKVYPNPFSDKLRFEFVSPESVNARIDLYDMTGRMVKTIFEQPIESGVSYDAEFKPETIISGMYFYRMTMGEAIFNGKVVFKK